MARMASQFGAPAIGGGGGYTDLMKQWERTQEGARLSNLQRAEQIKAIHQEIVRRYEPGGSFEAAGLGEIERAKTKGVGQEMQQMISSGLYGTTTAAGVPRRWESEVGAPSRLRLEDVMMQRLSQAQLGMAGFMERIEEPYPDYGALMGAMAQPGAAPGGGGVGGAGGVVPGTLAARWARERTEFEERAKATTVPTTEGKGAADFFSPDYGTFPTYQAMEEAIKKGAKKTAPTGTGEFYQLVGGGLASR